MGLLEDLTQRVKKFDIIDVKLAQVVAMFLTLIIAKLIPDIDGYQHLVVCGATDNMCDKAVLRVLVQGLVFFLPS